MGGRLIVVEFEPGRVFAWAIEDPAEPAALWRFRLEPKDGGTELSEWVQMGPGRSGLSLAIDRMPDKEQRSCSCGCASSSAT